MSTEPTLFLHQPGGRPWGMPNLSPFCSKLETYLRMAGWRYEWRPSSFRSAPKGKVPYVSIDGQLLGDSQLIIEELERRRGPQAALDGWLSEEQRGVGRAVRRMLDEGLYFAMVHLRWGNDAAWQVYKPRIGRGLGPARHFLPLIRRSVKKSLHAQGTGRHAPDEIERIAIADFSALAAIIGTREFVLGERPSTCDASAFAFIESVTGFPHPSRPREFVMQEARLMDYRARVRARWWSDLKSD